LLLPALLAGRRNRRAYHCSSSKSLPFARSGVQPLARSSSASCRSAASASALCSGGTRPRHPKLGDHATARSIPSVSRSAAQKLEPRRPRTHRIWHTGPCAGGRGRSCLGASSLRPAPARRLGRNARIARRHMEPVASAALSPDTDPPRNCRATALDTPGLWRYPRCSSTHTHLARRTYQPAWAWRRTTADRPSPPRAPRSPSRAREQDARARPALVQRRTPAPARRGRGSAQRDARREPGADRAPASTTRGSPPRERHEPVFRRR
jgi:hypothetical protein